MEVIYHEEKNGSIYKEIRSRRYQELAALGAEYIKKGAKIWINGYDLCAGIWMLTVIEQSEVMA